MKAKLTLSIDKKTIEQSKKFAKAHQKSVSSLVEKYLESLSDESEEWSPRKGSVVEKLSGAVKWPYGNKKSYDDILEDALLRKYGLEDDTN